MTEKTHIFIKKEIDFLGVFILWWFSEMGYWFSTLLVGFYIVDEVSNLLPKSAFAWQSQIVCYLQSQEEEASEDS